jgi:hypothetical protein
VCTHFNLKISYKKVMFVLFKEASSRLIKMQRDYWGNFIQVQYLIFSLVFYILFLQWLYIKQNKSHEGSLILGSNVVISYVWLVWIIVGDNGCEWCHPLWLCGTIQNSFKGTLQVMDNSNGRLITMLEHITQQILYFDIRKKSIAFIRIPVFPYLH